MKQIPTFRRGDILMTGDAARAAWETQPAGCPCGDCGEPAKAISGSCGDMPAQWLGCPNCGSACGYPLVFRTPSQTSHVLAEIKASSPAAIAAKTKQDADDKVRHLADLGRGWDGYQFIGIETGQAKLAIIMAAARE